MSQFCTPEFTQKNFTAYDKPKTYFRIYYLGLESRFIFKAINIIDLSNKIQKLNKISVVVRTLLRGWQQWKH